MKVSLLFPPTWHPSQPYLCSAVGKDEMLLSVPFRAALGFLSSLEPLPSMKLKGKGQALPVFCVKP